MKVEVEITEEYSEVTINFTPEDSNDAKILVFLVKVLERIAGYTSKPSDTIYVGKADVILMDKNIVLGW